MKLLPQEQEGLLLHQAGFLAQKRLARGLRLNYPEAVALIASQIQELARDGGSVAMLMQKGRHFLGRRQVQPGVEDIITDVQVEATFPDGTKLVTVHTPISRQDGDLGLALYGSFLPVPSLDVFKDEEESDTHPDAVAAVLKSAPGQTFPGSVDDITLNVSRKTTMLTVSSTCDRPIQVGSHYHFIETNKDLHFDRAAAYGMRLNIPAGTAIRFEPGETKHVSLVEIAGRKIIRGGNGICDGPVRPGQLETVMKRVAKRGFGDRKEVQNISAPPCSISRQLYIRVYGPTVGDKVRLGDTSLVIEVEKDYAVYGDECKFGGGKVLREGMGQASLITSAAALDTVITNALIVDARLGVVKADVGIKDGIIRGIGKAGNPDVMAGVTPGLEVGVGTEAIAGEGLVLTAGAVDCHIHFICPQQIREAVASGITTMIGGGTGPAVGTCATTCSPGPNHIKYMIQSTDHFPLNFGFTGKGNTSRSNGCVPELEEQIAAGAIGLKLHEDWGTTPQAIDCALRVADEHDVQITVHTDTLNESSCVEQTIEAFKGRTIHSYHTEGAGGGHAPDILRVCGEPNVLPSSTNPTRPYTVNTVDEHLDMLMVCHHLDRNLKEDIAFAESRIRGETIAAEDVLHDLGAISIISSDAQAMGRIGEVISRTWQTADKMKLQQGRLPEETGDNDNYRVRRYVAKYTVNPAIAHGVSHLIGSVSEGMLADLVLWSPAFFGTKPDMVIKGGIVAWASMGAANASIPTTQPVQQRKMFGAYGAAVAESSVIFVSQLSMAKGTVDTYGIKKKCVAVRRCRGISKHDMVLNNFVPNLHVDPQSFKVEMITEENGSVRSEHLMCPPAKRLPLSQKYYLF